MIRTVPDEESRLLLRDTERNLCVYQGERTYKNLQDYVIVGMGPLDNLHVSVGIDLSQTQVTTFCLLRTAPLDHFEDDLLVGIVQNLKALSTEARLMTREEVHLLARLSPSDNGRLIGLLTSRCGFTTTAPGSDVYVCKLFK